MMGYYRNPSLWVGKPLLVFAIWEQGRANGEGEEHSQGKEGEEGKVSVQQQTESKKNFKAK